MANGQRNNRRPDRRLLSWSAPGTGGGASGVVKIPVPAVCRVSLRRQKVVEADEPAGKSNPRTSGRTPFAESEGMVAQGWAVDVGATKILLGHRRQSGVGVIAWMPTPSQPQPLIAWLRRQISGRVAGIGVAFPGGMDAVGRVTGWPNQPRWAGFPLVEALKAVATAATVIDDGIAAAVGEAHLGVARGRPDVLVAVFGTGVGGALMIDHRVRPMLPGDPRTLGHLRIFPTGACACGGTGCAQLALATLPPDDRLGSSLAGWPDGARLADFLTDLARFLSIGAIVVTGGLLHRTTLREGLAARLAAAGIEPLVPVDPSISSLLGACVMGPT